MDGFKLVVGDIFDRLKRALELAEGRLVERTGAGVALALTAAGAGAGRRCRRFQIGRNVAHGTRTSGRDFVVSLSNIDVTKSAIDATISNA